MPSWTESVTTIMYEKNKRNGDFKELPYWRTGNCSYFEQGRLPGSTKNLPEKKP